jgi:hypothetical protein
MNSPGALTVVNLTSECARSNLSWSGSRTRTSRGDPAPSNTTLSPSQRRVTAEALEHADELVQAATTVSRMSRRRGSNREDSAGSFHLVPVFFPEACGLTMTLAWLPSSSGPSLSWR